LLSPCSKNGAASQGHAGRKERACAIAPAKRNAESLTSKEVSYLKTEEGDISFGGAKRQYKSFRILLSGK
jgi:hypothetical protein